MSNLDFLLNCTDITETIVNKENNHIIVTGIFNGNEDLSWTEYEYIFDINGNYISHREINSHR